MTKPEIRSISRIEDHPAYPTVAPLFECFPTYAQPLWQTFTDISLSQKWTQVELAWIDMGNVEAGRSGGRPIVIGKRPMSGQQTKMTAQRSVIIPTLMNDRWDPDILVRLFESLERINSCPRPSTDSMTSLNNDMAGWELVDKSPPLAGTGDDIARDHVFFAITDLDSSIVYYRIWKGIKKPKEWRDE